MKPVISLIFCLIFSSYCLSQSITLLYRGPSGWNDPNSWIQLNTPVGQTPVSRVPLYSDDVIFSRAMSGISNFGFDGDVIIGAGPESICRSMQVYNTEFSFNNSLATDRAAYVNIYTINGGYFSADSGSNISRGIFYLHGGNPAITDFQIRNSRYGQLFTHAQWSGVELMNNARVKFINSHLEGNIFANPDPNTIFFADGCEFITPVFQLGANSTDSLFNSVIKTGNNFVTLLFSIGPGANFVSSNLSVSSFASLKIITSGSILNGNILVQQPPGELLFDQFNNASPLPNIINGNLSTFENSTLNIKGDLKISGNMYFNTVAEVIYNQSTVYVNGQPIFISGGLPAGVTKPSNIEFFGNNDCEVRWPLGFPIDTLVINKNGCAKLRFQNSLYVTGKTTITQGQLVLDPNDTIPFKFVCLGDLELMPGGGLFLRRNDQNIVAGMAIQGDIIDNNPIADSTCTGISNPYGGNITMYRLVDNEGNNNISIVHPQGLPNLHLAGRPGSGFILTHPLTVTSPFTVQMGELNLNNQALTVKP